MQPAVTPLQQEAWSLMMAMPEWRLVKTVNWMKRPAKRYAGLAQDLESRRQAFEELEQVIEPLAEFDYDKALDEALMEKYGEGIA